MAHIIEVEGRDIRVGDFIIDPAVYPSASASAINFLYVITVSPKEASVEVGIRGWQSVIVVGEEPSKSYSYPPLIEIRNSGEKYKVIRDLVPQCMGKWAQT